MLCDIVPECSKISNSVTKTEALSGPSAKPLLDKTGDELWQLITKISIVVNIKKGYKAVKFLARIKKLVLSKAFQVTYSLSEE